MSVEKENQNSTAYKILQYLREREADKYDFVDIQTLRDMIRDESPEAFEQFETDNPQEPREPKYDDTSAGEYAERMAGYQRLK